MLLHQFISRLDEADFVTDLVANLNDLALATRALEIAEIEQMTLGQVFREQVERYVAAADDDEWLSAFGAISSSSDPGAALIRRAFAAVC